MNEFELQRLIVRMIGDVSNYVNSIVQAETVTARARDQIVADMASINDAVMKIGDAAIKSAASFEFSMAKIVGLANASKEQVSAWTNDLLRLAPQLGKMPDELAHALFFVKSAGIEGAQAIDLLTQAGKASTAGLGEMAIVARAATSAVNAYGKAGMTAGKALDIVAAAVSAGKFEAASLTPILGRLLPMASEMGVRLEDVLGVLAAMTRSGLNAAEASIAIQAAFTRLMKPTKAATELMAAAGMTFDDIRAIAAKPGGLLEVMRLIDKTFGASKDSIGKMSPNIRDLRGLFAILVQDADKVDAVMKQVAEHTGMVDKAFGVAAETGTVKWQQVMAGVKVLMIEVGSVILSNLKPSIDFVRQVIEDSIKAWQSLDINVKRFLVTSVGITTTILTIVSALVVLSAIVGSAFFPLFLVVGLVGIAISAMIYDVGELTVFVRALVTENKAAIITFLSIAGVIFAANLAYKLIIATIGLLNVLMAITGLKVVLNIALWIVWKAVIILAKIAIIAFNIGSTAATIIINLLSGALAGASISTAILTMAMIILQSVMAGVIAVVSIVIGLLTAFVVMVPIVGAVVGVLWGTISGLGAALYVVFNTLKQMPTDAEGPLGRITTILMEWYDILQYVIFAIRTDGTLAWQLLEASATLALNQIRDLWQALWPFILSTASVTATAAGEAFKSAFREAFATVMYEAASMFGKIGKIAYLGFAIAFGGNGVVKKDVTEIVDDAGRKIAEIAKEFGASFKESDATKNARDTINQIKGYIDEADFWNWIDEMGKENDPLKPYKDRIQDSVELPAKNAKAALDKMNSALYGSGDALRKIQAYTSGLYGEPTGVVKATSGTRGVGAANIGGQPAMTPIGGGSVSGHLAMHTTLLTQIRDILFVMNNRGGGVPIAEADFSPITI